MRIFRKLAQLLDVDADSPGDGERLTWDAGAGKWVPGAPSGGGGAPTDANYLVGTANGDLSAEIVVGTSPGGELGGTWASPTVDATHSGSSHASVQAAAEATAAGALSAHASDTTGVHGIADTSSLVLTGDTRLTDSRTPTGTAGGVLGGTYPNPSFAADMATQAELDAAISGLSATYQPLDSDLTAFSGLAIAADKLPYGTGSHTLGLTDLSSFIRSVLDDADAATARATLGVIASLFQSGGAQAIKLDDLATPDDNTDLNASTSAHGLLKKLDNNAAHFLDGTGAWTTPSASLPADVAYVEFTSSVAISATSEASPTDVVSAGAISFDGSTRVKIEFFCPRVDVGASAGSWILANLWDGSTDLGRIWHLTQQYSSANGQASAAYGVRILTPSNASHTYKIRGWRISANGSFEAGAGGASTTMPGFIRITRTQ